MILILYGCTGHDVSVVTLWKGGLWIGHPALEGIHHLHSLQWLEQCRKTAEMGRSDTAGGGAAMI